MSGGCCGGSQSKAQGTTITQEQLSEIMARRDPVQVVNVLDPQWYSLGVIKGSKKIPLAELERRLGELDQKIPVVTYCANYECSASSDAAKLLAKHGYQVKAYEGGIKEWTAAGLPVEKAQQPTSVASSCGPSCCSSAS